MGDYLLSASHEEHKKKLLFMGTFEFKDVVHWLEDKNQKVSFVNVFGAPW